MELKLTDKTEGMPKDRNSLIKITKEIPLIGHIAFGLILRGSNLIQVRPTTLCNLRCPFCSTASNDPNIHSTDYEVEPDYLIKTIKEVVNFKECNNTEINIDSVGEPLMYPKLTYLIKEIKKIPQVKKISMQTNGTLLTKDNIKQLEQAGLNHINLSIHTLDEKQAKELSGNSNYDIKKILNLLKEIEIDLWLTPVWIPNINDKEIIKIIQLAKSLNLRLGIQKYEIYKYSRKMKKAKKINYYKFYKKLSEWEKEFNVKLKIGPSDFNIQRTKKLPPVFKKGEKLQATTKLPGWFKNQTIAIARNRTITINKKLPLNKKINIKILQNKNNIYLAN